MIVSLVFSVYIKICKNLYVQAKNDFWKNKLLLEKCSILFVQKDKLNSYGELICRHTTSQKNSVSEWLILKSYFSLQS